MATDDPLEDLTYPGESDLGTAVTLLPISPQRLLATWAAGSLGSNGEAGGGNPDRHGTSEVERKPNGQYRLRVHDISNIDFRGDNSNRQWVYELEDGQSGWVIDLDRPGLRVCAELLEASDGNGEAAVARSRRVHMPSSEPSAGNGQIQWLICERNGHRK